MTIRKALFLLGLIFHCGITSAQLNLYIGAPIGVSIHDYQKQNWNEDFTYSTDPTVYGALNFEFRFKRLGVLLSGETEGWSNFKWEMKSCDCSNQYGTVNRVSRIGVGVVYYPELGVDRFELYGGLSFDNYKYYFHGEIGSGHPFQFPTRENDYRVVAQLGEDGNAASFLAGGYYHLSPKFSIGLHVRYSAWLGKEPITDWDIRYYSSDFAYDMRLKDTGRILHLSTGFRLNVNGRNYQK